MKKKNIFLVMILFMTAPISSLASTYAPWLTQIGITDKVMENAKSGSGQILAVVDSGISTIDPAFSKGQILTDRSSFAGVTYQYAHGFNDNNGHGTAVAEIAAANAVLPYKIQNGQYSTQAGSIISVAPDAKIIVEKVLDKTGSCSSLDLANGIRKAADAGASVINVSISYSNDRAMVSAINYAAGKNAFMVWAGGNESTDLLDDSNTRGLTPEAINHLIFAGSVDSKNKISYFSNTPGTGSFINTQGAKTTYASRWAMAPGEDIIAHDVMRNANHYYSWSGTSMSTPVISGSLLLLENIWPILKTNGTTANLLLETATSLGDTATYGQGLINLTHALNRPNGALSLKLSNGSSLPLSRLNGGTVLSEALGSQAEVRAKLASYTTFDSYDRDFTVDLSGLVKAPCLPAKLNPFLSHPNKAVAVMTLQDGSELSYAWAHHDALQTLGSQFEYVMQVDSLGNASAWGYGFPVQFPYAKALYRSDDWAKLSSDLGVSNAASLAQGGGLAVYGRNLDDKTRVAASWSNREDSSNINLGLTRQINNLAALGIHYSLLSENNGLLGSRYAADSILNFGANNKSYYMGLSALLGLLPQSKLLLEAGLSETKPEASTGLFVGTTAIQSQSLGVGILQNGVLNNNDSLVISLKQPLRIASGQVGIAMLSLDRQGVPVFNTEYVNLAPGGREMDYKIAYDRPIGKMLALSVQAMYCKDLLNIKGKNDTNIGVLLKSSL